MALTEERRIFPEDVAFQQATGQLYGAGETMRRRPLGYSRRGGAALLGGGGMYGSLYDASRRAMQQQEMARLARQVQWDRAARMKRATTEGMRAQAAAGIASAGYGMFTDWAAKNKPWGAGF